MISPMGRLANAAQHEFGTWLERLSEKCSGKTRPNMDAGILE
jgi:hypothetical protein